MFKQGDLIELEGLEEKFVVLKQINDLGKIFIVLASEDDPTQLKFCVLENNTVKIIQDPKVIEEITNKIEQK